MSREAQPVLLVLLVAACAATVLAHTPRPPAPVIPGLGEEPRIPVLTPPGTPSHFPPGTPDQPPSGIPGLFPPGIPGILPPIPGLLPPGLPGLFPPGIPGLSPPGNPADIAKCWSSFQGIPGCAWEIYASIFTGKLALGPACCKALQGIDANCLTKMLPPLFPPLPKGNCTPGNNA